MAQSTKKGKGSRKDFEIWANRLMKKYQAILMTNDFTLEDIKPSGSKGTSTSQFRYPYKEIEIAYGESIFEYWQKGDKETAERVLLHEMIHPITDKLYAVAWQRFASENQLENEREQLTDHFTNVLYKLIK